MPEVIFQLFFKQVWAHYKVDKFEGHRGYVRWQWPQKITIFSQFMDVDHFNGLFYNLWVIFMKSKPEFQWQMKLF